MTFGIAMLSLSFAINGAASKVKGPVLRIVARILGAIGLIYAFAIFLFIASSAAAFEESTFRVKRRRCVLLIAPSVLCGLVSLAHVIAESC